MTGSVWFRLRLSLHRRQSRDACAAGWHYARRSLQRSGRLRAFEARRDILVPRRPDEGIAIVRAGELVRRYAGGAAFAVPDAEPVRQRDVTALHRRGELDRHGDRIAPGDEAHA